MHSLMSIFHCHIQEMEREDNSIMEIKKTLSSIDNVIERKTNNFMSLKVKGLLAAHRREGLGEGCDKFMAEVLGMHAWSTWRNGWRPWKNSHLSCGWT